MEKSKIIPIVGPTASGKSSLGLYLAEKLHGEIISADSRQIYKGMEIISRAPSRKEMAAIPHHLVSIANPKRQYSAGTYATQAEKTIAHIIQKNHLPIVVGGAGFYADTLLRGLTLPEVAPDKKLRATLSKKSAPQLLEILKKLDPKSAARVDARNPVRLIRAIEIAQTLGSVPALTYTPLYDVLWLGLAPEPNKHLKAIQKGVEERLKMGMIPEAKKLRASLSKKRFLELGFEFALLAGYLDKKISKKELAEGLVKGEINYAKRQMRWFKRNKDITWVKSKTEALRLAKAFISG